MKTGRARRQPLQHQLVAAGNRFYAPSLGASAAGAGAGKAPAATTLPANPDQAIAEAPAGTADLPPRPAWLRLGAKVRAEGQVLGIVSIRLTVAGGWEVLGHLTANRWYGAGEVEPL
jgi:hypothetical protein